MEYAGIVGAALAKIKGRHARPAPVEFMGRLHVEAVGLQPLVKRVHPAFLPEADVKGRRVNDLRRLGEIVQGQNEPRLVNRHYQGVALAPRNAPEAKVRFEECPCLRDIRNSEIEMVQCHVCVPPRAENRFHRHQTNHGSNYRAAVRVLLLRCRSRSHRLSRSERQACADWPEYGSWLPRSGFVPDDQPAFEAWMGRLELEERQQVSSRELDHQLIRVSRFINA
jgi:hypothetical protein